MVNFPASLDTGATLPTPAAGNNTNSPSHSSLHGAENAAIIAVEGKVGIGATTPAVNQLLFGTGTGTTAWQGLTSAQLLAILSDETGTGSAVFATTPTLVTPKVDTINEATGGNGTTIGGVNIKSGALNTSSSVPTAAIQSSAVTSDKLATGVPVQLVATTFNAVATGTTVLPSDDTIPQNTEGDQYMTQAITPKSATNRLFIETKFQGTLSAVPADITAALFQDATAGALGVGHMVVVTAGYMTTIIVGHDMVAGTTSSTTFKVRAGPGSAATLTFNGSVGIRRYGGISFSYIKITEYKA